MPRRRLNQSDPTAHTAVKQADKADPRAAEDSWEAERLRRHARAQVVAAKLAKRDQ